MKYAVAWHPRAEPELATAWLHATDRAAVTAAASRVDALLATRPHDQGESRSGKVRIMFEKPLAVEFAIADDERTVYVLAVWTF